MVAVKLKFACGPKILLGALLAVLAGCAGAPETAPPDVSAGQPQGITPASELDWRKLPSPNHTLANFRPGETPDYCFDRATQPNKSIRVDPFL